MRYGESRVRLKHLNKNSNVHIFIGPNGSGKSQSLFELKNEINEKYNDGNSFDSSSNPFILAMERHHKDINVPVYHYKTHANDRVDNSNFDISKMVSAFSSEGERMNSSWIDWCSEVWLPHLKKHRPKEYWLLFDELDSGLSFDRLSLQLYQLSGIIKAETEHGYKPNIVITSNSYELLEVTQELFDNVSIYWVPTRKEIEINSYIKFRNLYKSRFKKMKEELENE